MEQGTGFKLIMGFAVFAIAILLWMPLADIMGTIITAVNAMDTGSAAYNAEMIAHNNNVGALFASFPVFLLMAWAIYVIKGALDERGAKR